MEALRIGPICSQSGDGLMYPERDGHRNKMYHIEKMCLCSPLRNKDPLEWMGNLEGRAHRQYSLKEAKCQKKQKIKDKAYFSLPSSFIKI